MSIFQTKYDRILKKIENEGIIINKRIITVDEGIIKILFVKQLVDTDALSEQIIKPLLQYKSYTKPLNSQQIMDNIILSCECTIETDATKIEENILDGMVVLLLNNGNNYLVVNIKKIEHRTIDTPELTYTIRGPKDCFVENFDVNISLIRYRLKDPNLRIDNFKVGKRSKTSVAVIYIKDIANENTVMEIKKRISEIDIDIIWGTGELQAFLQKDNHSLFPILGTTERSDWGCEAIVEGRVLIIADGGQIALIAPHTFGDTIVACDDRYDNKFFGLFSRVLRLISLFITLCLSAIFVAVVDFHDYVLPATYIIFIAELRQEVIFSVFFEILIVEFISELIRESLIRVPSKIGTAVGIVGAIVIGQAAIAAGIFTPFVLIISSVGLMASFTIPDYFTAHPIRLLRFFVIIMTGFLGFYGFVLALILITLNLVSINSFGVPYMAPFAPFNLYDAIRAFFFSRSHSPKRPQLLRTIDDTRSSDDKIKN